MKRYKVSYYYLATGMEGRADVIPERIIEAENEDLANYLFMVQSGYFESFRKTSFLEFMKRKEYERKWGMSIIEENSTDE